MKTTDTRVPFAGVRADQGGHHTAKLLCGAAHEHCVLHQRPLLPSVHVSGKGEHYFLPMHPFQSFLPAKRI